MNDETEIWGELTAQQFQIKLTEFSDKFGKPLLSKRLALQADHFKRHDLDTRIRITDGQTELVQKVGSWEATTRSEIHVKLDLDANGILNLYQLLINQLPLKHRQTNLIQYSNYIFNTSDYEIKLGEQSGKQTVYHYELEAKTSAANLENKRLELGLPESLRQSDEAFWTAWNQRVNLNYDDLSKQQLIELIQKYLS